MTKQRLSIIILIILSLAVLIVAGYKISEQIGKKKISEEISQEELELRYKQQNDAFFGWYGVNKYMPYDKECVWKTQVHMSFYIRHTGKTITAGDVKTFLANPENPNGTPRTWQDDETGIIKDFVDWFRWGQNIDEFRFYSGNLQDILTAYCDARPGCPYTQLSKLTPDQIIELDKKYLDPDYDLVLMW
ncbi:MAG: hypothetical protein FWF88_07245 [Peptococcaceae bacterium]|nr:hypothetical protein [Peptococcaceae bacterium]